MIPSHLDVNKRLPTSSQEEVTGMWFILSPKITKLTKCMKQQFSRHWMSGNKGQCSLIVIKQMR